tara:strand:- start:3537 stop:4106 length:570 start_codon:yes stop_codon:yes gene_type:complete
VNHSESRTVVFLDRDGTLNPDPGYISSLDQFQFFPNALVALQNLDDQEFAFIIVTNQSGIARGKIKQENLDAIHRFIEDQFEASGIPLLGVYVCPHHPDEGCRCRKPGTALFERAAKDHSIELDRSYIIGDSEADIRAGKALSMKTVLVRTGNGKLTERILAQAMLEIDLSGNNLTDCIDFIIGDKSSK